jgi:putative ABC transport system permease protein
MTSMLQAWRALVRRPLFTLATIVTIAAGIGVTTASFSIVDRVLVRPLPFPDGDQLVSVYEASPSRRERISLVAPVRLTDWNRLNRTFEVISGSYSDSVTDTSGAEPERLEARRVLARYFDVFGMTPLLGRAFTPDEERYGGATAVVISEALWTRRYGRASDVVGRRLTIAGRGCTIVGVMPRAFTSAMMARAFTGASIDVWLPAQLSPQLMSIREARFLGGVGRMRRGVTLEQARSDLADVQRQLGQQFPKTDKDWSVQVQDLKETRVGDYRRALLLLFGAVALLLLIAIANVAGLMLVQLRRRAAEFAIRSAIGASHVQVMIVVMREVIILAVLGGLAGAAIAAWLTRVIATNFSTIPRMAEVSVDGRALAFAAGASVLAAMAFGLIPALHASRRRLGPLLSSAGRGIFGSRHRLQGALVVAQIALSVLLAGAAGLLVRSYGELTKVPTGFDTTNVLTFHVGAAWDEDRARVGQLQTRLLAELQQLPGVRAAGYTNFLPATGATLRYQVRVAGLAGPEDNGMLTVGERSVTSGYLKALQVPLVAGEWSAEPRADGSAEQMAMGNRRFVDVYAGGTNLLGRVLTLLQLRSGWGIGGVVGNMLEDGASMPPAPYAYICLPAGGWPDPEYVVRADSDPRAVLTAVRQIVRTLDASRPIFGVRAVGEVIDASLDQPRLNARFLAMFAAAALALAALGLYGLLTLLVAERRREIGVRMALGASTRDLIQLILGGAGRLIAIGALSGLALTLAAGRVLHAMLFGVTAHDPGALAAGVLAMAVASALAIAIPARQAVTVSPVEAIRGE